MPGKHFSSAQLSGSLHVGQARLTESQQVYACIMQLQASNPATCSRAHPYVQGKRLAEPQQAYARTMQHRPRLARHPSALQRNVSWKSWTSDVSDRCFA